MATTKSPSGVPKPSFAKVAASASKDHPPVVSSRQVTSPSGPVSITQATIPVIANGATNYMRPRAGFPHLGGPTSSKAAAHDGGNMVDLVGDLVTGIRNATLETRAPSLVVNGSGSSLPDRLKIASGGDSSPDDSQKADSTSDLGTKPPSLDGKSITSGTTFALDEKESLRPDDSASVKAAAVEDDDAFSIRGSLLAGSRMGSDIAGRRIQLEEHTDRRTSQPNVGAQGVVVPQGPAGQPNPAGPSIPTDALNIIYRKAPDEKLLEAMQSPKDRIFLLRLEKDVIDFVRDSKEPYMDLPPCNSFCRMLTHKLADYYHMTHSYEPSIGAVRIFRTPFCRVPQSLASIAESTSAANTPPPVVIPRKIMRREDSGDKAVSSAGPSKPTSEAGSDDKEKASQLKEKMTQEEREEAYNRARERIFGSSEKNGESLQDNDNGVSRASSVSGKDKSNGGRRGRNERRRRDSGSFESRAQYAVYYPPPQQSPWATQPQYIHVATPPFNGQVQPPFPNQAVPVYIPPGQSFSTMMPNTGYPPAYTNMPQYPPQPNAHRYPPPGNTTAGAYGPAAPPGQSPPTQSWQSPPFNPPPGSFSQRANIPSAPPALSQMGSASLGIPYLYGQLPANANPNDPKSQHPIPGSYNRHAFNPKTQSFVPNTGMAPMQGQVPPYVPGGSHHGSPQVGSPHLAYAGSPYQIPIAGPPPGPQQPYNDGYAMARQGSNNSMMAFHHPPQHVQHPPPLSQVPHPAMPQHMPPNHPAQPPNKAATVQVPLMPGQAFSHLPPHYGNPSTLPQKPT